MRLRRTTNKAPLPLGKIEDGVTFLFFSKYLDFTEVNLRYCKGINLQAHFKKVAGYLRSLSDSSGVTMPKAIGTAGVNESNLIRLHPTSGGKEIEFGNQRFCGVSPDIFIALDLYNYAIPYRITRKFNLTVAVSPKLWPTEDFFTFLTKGGSPANPDPFNSKALKQIGKCEIHGDEDTGLVAHGNLFELLDQEDLQKFSADSIGFDTLGARYVYVSIGVAANSNFGSVLNR